MSLASRIENLTMSKTQAINDRASQMAREGRDVIDLGAGDPRFREPDPARQAGISAIEDGFTGYTEAGGIPELRRAIGRRYSKVFGIDVDESEVLVTAGAKAALFELVQLTVDPGDEVIVPRPYYPSYVSQVALVGAKPVTVSGTKENHYLPTGTEMGRQVSERTKAILINSPGNPTGGVYDSRQLQEIVELADAHDLFLISDECYDGFTYERDRFCTLVSFDYSRGFTVGSASKSFAMTGWRLGYVVGDRKYMGELEKVQSHLTSSPSSISQKAAQAAFTKDLSLPDKTLRQFERKRNYLAKTLNEVEGIDCPAPPGSFYLFPDVRSLLKSAGLGEADEGKFARSLLEEAGVVTVPGGAFGLGGFLRIAYLPGLERLEEASSRISSAVERVR